MEATRNEATPSIGWNSALALASLLIGLGYAAKAATERSAVDWQIAALIWAMGCIVMAFRFDEQVKDAKAVLGRTTKANRKALALLAAAVASTIAFTLLVLYLVPPTRSPTGALTEIVKIYAVNGVGAVAIAWVIRMASARYARR